MPASRSDLGVVILIHAAVHAAGPKILAGKTSTGGVLSREQLQQARQQTYLTSMVSPGKVW